MASVHVPESQGQELVPDMKHFHMDCVAAMYLSPAIDQEAVEQCRKTNTLRVGISAKNNIGFNLEVC